MLIMYTQNSVSHILIAKSDTNPPSSGLGPAHGKELQMPEELNIWPIQSTLRASNPALTV